MDEDCRAFSKNAVSKLLGDKFSLEYFLKYESI